MERLDELERQEEEYNAKRVHRLHENEKHESALRVARLRVASGRVKKPIKKKQMRWSKSLREKDCNVKLLESFPNKSEAELSLLVEMERERDVLWQREHDASLAAFYKRNQDCCIEIRHGEYWAVDKHAALLARCTT